MKRSIQIILLILNCTFALQSFAQDKKINTSLEYKVNMPLKKSEKTPVLIMLHGYGSNEGDLFDISKAFDERLITFSLRGPYSAPGGDGFAWYSLEKTEKNELKYNYKEAAESRKKILSFISNACREYKLDSTQVFLIGFSQGAMMSYDIAYSHPQKVKGIIALSGRLMKESKEQKGKEEQILKLNFFIGHGTQDNLIPVTQSEEVATWLKENEGNVTYKTYPIPHSISGNELNDIKEFLKKNLKREK